MTDDKPTDASAAVNEFFIGMPGSQRPTRDAAGRWLAGKPGGPGRPRGYDFRAAVSKAIEERGGDMNAIMVAVFDSMFLAAIRGDVGAAKLLLDRICGKEPDLLDAALTTARTMTPVERATRIQSILSDAAKRLGDRG